MAVADTPPAKSPPPLAETTDTSTPANTIHPPTSNATPSDILSPKQNPVVLDVKQSQRSFSQVVQGFIRPNQLMEPKQVLDLDSCLKPIAIVQGKQTVIFPLSEKKVLVDKLKLVLVGKFSHGMPGLNYIRNFFAAMKLQRSCTVSFFDRKHIFIECFCKNDYDFIWLNLAWVIEGFTMRVLKWSDDFNPTKESAIVPVWVRLEGLPLYMFDEMSLLAIGNSVGKPIKVDPRNVNRSIVNSARICVELDVSKHLLDSIWVSFEDEVTKVVFEGFKVNILYDEVPHFCEFCCHLGHDVGRCKRREENALNNEHSTTARLPVRASSRVQETSVVQEGSWRGREELSLIFKNPQTAQLSTDMACSGVMETPTVQNLGTSKSKQFAGQLCHGQTSSKDRQVTGVMGTAEGLELFTLRSKQGNQQGNQQGSIAEQSTTNQKLIPVHVIQADGNVKGIKQLDGMLVMSLVEADSLVTVRGAKENTVQLHAPGQMVLQEDVLLHSSDTLFAENVEQADGSCRGGLELAAAGDCVGTGHYLQQLEQSAMKNQTAIQTADSTGTADHSLQVSVSVQNVEQVKKVENVEQIEKVEHVEQVEKDGHTEIADKKAKEQAKTSTSAGTNPQVRDATLAALVEKDVPPSQSAGKQLPGVLAGPSMMGFQCVHQEQLQHVTATGGAVQGQILGAVLAGETAGVSRESGSWTDTGGFPAAEMETETGGTAADFIDALNDAPEQIAASSNSSGALDSPTASVIKNLDFASPSWADLAEEKEKEEQIRIVSQLSPSEIEEYAKQEMEKIWNPPTMDAHVLDTSPSNPYILDKDGHPVSCAEVIRNSIRLAAVRFYVDKVKNRNSSPALKDKAATLKEKWLYDKLMIMYSEEISMTIKEHQSKDTSLSHAMITQGSVDEKEWTTAKRRGRNRSRSK